MEQSTGQSVNPSTAVTEAWINTSSEMEVALKSHDGRLELYLTVLYLITVLLVIVICKYKNLDEMLTAKRLTMVFLLFARS